jgi:hypothetical protein
MLRPSFAFLALLLASTAAQAQVDTHQEGASGQTNLNALTTNAPTMTPRPVADGTKGSPYADDRWRMAQITLSNKLPLAPVPIKYDVLSQRLLMHKAAPSPDSLQLDDRLVQQFVLQSPTGPGQTAQPRVFRRFAEAANPAERGDYVEVLHQGSYTLLKRHRRTVKKADIQGAYSTNNRYDEIVDLSEYYLAPAGAAAMPVKLNVKSVSAVAPALQAPLKAAAAGKPLRTDADWALVLDVADPSTAK